MDVSDFLHDGNEVINTTWAEIKQRHQTGENLEMFDAMRLGVIAGYEAGLRDNGLPPLTNKYIEESDKRIAAANQK
jgi:hypothetical protein